MGVKIKRKPFVVTAEKNEELAKKRRVRCRCCDRLFHPNDRFPGARYCDSHCLFVWSLTPEFFRNIAKKTWDLPEYLTYEKFPQYLTNLRGL